MNDENDSIGHLYDGVDIDDSRNRPRSYRFPEAANLVDDLQELSRMDEADINRYAGPLPGIKFIKR